MSGDPVVDIVIPTYNEERNIARLLTSIQSQLGCPYAVVVVDQGSSDRTAEIVRSYGWPVLDFAKSRVYSPPAQSRNLGALSAAGRILLHLDADMELPSPTFLADLVSLFATGYDAVIVREYDVASGFWAKCKALERSCYWGTEMESARGVTRALFALVGGYDEEISSGEDLFINALYKRHTRLGRSDTLVLKHHLGNPSLKQLLTKKYAYGKTAGAYLTRARESGAASSVDIVKMSIAAYLKNWRLVREHPVLYLSIVPLRALELFAVQLGRWSAGQPEVASTPPV